MAYKTYRLTMTAAKEGFLILLSLFLAASILLPPQTASAQSKPSTPEFTAKYVNLNYDVPSTYGTDQYTGKTIVTQQGYTIDNRSIHFTIKNQPFMSTSDVSGNVSGLFFNFRVKGVYGTDKDWGYYPFMPDGQSSGTYGGIFPYTSQIAPAPAFSQSTTETTTVTITIPGAWRVPKGATLDVQVQAIVGYMYYMDKQYHFVGEFGDWSNTQTVIIPDPPTPNDPYSPSTDQYLAPTATAPVFTPQNSTEQWSLFSSPTLSAAPQNATLIPIQPATQAGVVSGLDWQAIVIAVLAVTVILLAVVVLIQRKSVRN
jgi:hypothetical protein